MSKPVVQEFPKVVVLGLARNCAATLPITLDRIESWRLDGPIRIIIGEDGSTDHTREIVQARAELVDTTAETATSRLTRMANARELVKQRYQATPDCDLVVVLDMDGDFASAIDGQWLARAWQRLQADKDVFALAATSRPYYDLLAFESDTESHAGLEKRIARAQQHPLTYRRFKRQHIYAAQDRLTLATETRCISAFNGAAVYLSKRYLEGTYLSGPDTSPLCEHVVFNRGIAAGGARMIIDPDLLVPAPDEHIRQSALWFYLQAFRRQLARFIAAFNPRA